ncbi:origin recognition complex, subunit 6 [Metschnikowia bicuspidata var. bicuspidata NRRL YB-4993]|uniref:Origin recognition complex, subunit 6 n=1 Tax=Metschnikowia bicuspidata var. bicuspidata NRRL YB-4993 TaxID=869754 RepID=A0A1A0HHU6_9ASCO|nr:origin recognition complex, subunit 6 [Metschnikowia bicuspidata var. bicuspidata NRRL YB-4993]OBA23576.1 origin recognition complex, subunit 6 [Metschnikowia bicuspidata var. bicuspidata NRRL YB-4993]
MNRSHIQQSLKDIVPNFAGAYPPALLSYIDSVYQLSLQKLPILPHKADVARYHLCTYLTVERYQQKFSLPTPNLQKVPVQPKFLEKLLDDIQDKVMSSMSTPASTPKKLFADEMLPSKKRPFTPTVGSPLRKLQKLLGIQDEPPQKAVESPFNTPLKSLATSPTRDIFKTPRTSPAKNPQTCSPSSSRYLKQLSIPDFVSFANNFYIPASVTPHLLEMFVAERYKFVRRNEWLLACGLIHAAYVRINDKLFKNTIGKKSEFQDQLFQYQKGNLMKKVMIEWINRVEESVKGQPWALDLELKYVHNDWTVEDTTREKEIEAKLGKGWEIVRGLGSFIDPSVMFDKPSQIEYYNTWARRLREKVKSLGTPPPETSQDLPLST